MKQSIAVKQLENIYCDLVYMKKKRLSGLIHMNKKFIIQLYTLYIIVCLFAVSRIT